MSTYFRLIVKILRYPDLLYQAPAPIESSGKGYIWHEMGFMSISSGSRSKILCFDVPDDVIKGLQIALPASAEQCGDPFGLHIPLLEELVKIYDHSVWLMANEVRDIEKVSRDEHFQIIKPNDGFTIAVPRLTEGTTATARKTRKAKLANPFPPTNSIFFPINSIFPFQGSRKAQRHYADTNELCIPLRDFAPSCT